MAVDETFPIGLKMAEIAKLYYELADWWYLLSPAEVYAEEAAFYRDTILAASIQTPRTLLELGSGGGNNASHMKSHFRLTLVDLSSEMLRLSQQLNPECEHIQGDMRTVRLQRQFDAVFVQDAITYMASAEDLQKVLHTACQQCKVGGVALFAPDCTRESFRPATDHGGVDQGQRGLRYLEWSYDPDPGDTSYVMEMVYLLKDGNQPVRCVHEQHVCGLFGRQDWLRWIEEAGFRAKVVPFVHSQVDGLEVFVGMRVK